MQRVKLDRIDRLILHQLQENGRITNVELARRAGISPPPCLRRVRALELAGYIRGYHAEIAPELLDYKETFFALVGLDSQSQTILEEFEKILSDWDEVRECHMIRGGGDFLLKLSAIDKEHRDSLTMRLTAVAHVTNVKTLETIRTSKSRSGVPIDIGAKI